VASPRRGKLAHRADEAGDEAERDHPRPSSARSGRRRAGSAPPRGARSAR